MKPSVRLNLVNNPQFTIHLSEGALIRLRAAVRFAVEHNIQDTIHIGSDRVAEAGEWEHLKRSLCGPFDV